MDKNQRIIQLRKALGMNQTQFGEHLGLTKVSISFIETGKRVLTESNRRAILREFNVNPKWLDYGEGNMFINFENTDQLTLFVAQVLQADDNDIRKKVIEAMSKLPPEHWHYIEEIIDTVKKQ